MKLAKAQARVESGAEKKQTLKEALQRMERLWEEEETPQKKAEEERHVRDE